MRNGILLLASALLLVGTPPNAAAQRVEFDSTLGKYRVHYHSDHLGRSVTAVVDAPNKIEPALTLTDVRDVGEDFVYEYTILNAKSIASRQAVVQLDFDCPAKELISSRTPRHWTIIIGSAWSSPRHTCALIEESPDRRAAIRPGQILPGMEIETAMLPAVRMARFWGDAEEIEWPEGESGEVLDLSVSQAVDRVSGITGGWVERTVVTPTRDPRGLGASDILQGLEEDLVKVCEEREWISEALCRSYRASLSDLMMAVSEERSTGAREQAADLLGDVEESWQAPERQLEPDAYWLLRRNLEAVLTRLADDTPSEGGSGETLSSGATGPAPAPAADARAPRQSTGFWSRLWRAIRNLPAA